jgi:hypothetical protein
MIKISISSIIAIIRICRGVAIQGLPIDNYIEKCKTLISAYMGLPDMFNVTNPEDDSLHQDS